MENNETSLRELRDKLTVARMELIDSNKSQRKDAQNRVADIEREVDSKLSDLRKSQDALRKAIGTRRSLLQTLEANRNDSSSFSSSEGENSSVETKDED